MSDEKCVKMIQTSRQLWKMVSSKGCVIKEDVMVYSEYEANEYVRKYISSFSGWSYVVLPIKGGKNE